MADKITAVLEAIREANKMERTIQPQLNHLLVALGREFEIQGKGRIFWRKCNIGAAKLKVKNGRYESTRIGCEYNLTKSVEQNLHDSPELTDFLYQLIVD